MSSPPRRQVHMIGLPTDSNSSFLRGPAKGPGEIRSALFSEHGNPAAENGLEIGAEIDLVDLGDLALAEAPSDDALIEDAVLRIARAGHLPILLGGDHSITAPVVRALAKVHGPLNILHFDAHADLYDALDGNPRSHASPFARIMEAGAASHLVQVGIRTLNRHQREQAQRFGVEIIPAAAFAPQAVPVLAAPLYVSIDLDGFDPSVAPGVSHHEPGGFTVREVLAALARQSARLVGADVVELNPDRDLNGVTAVVAAKLVKEIAASAGAA